VAQSDALDAVAEKYDRAKAALDAATTEVDRAQAELDSASAQERAVASSVAKATGALRQAAIDAYVTSGAAPAGAVAGNLVNAYEQRRAIVQTALAGAAVRVQELRAAQRQRQEAQLSAAVARQKAESARAGAQMATAKAKSAAQAAAFQQATLLATLSQVNSNLAQLVAVADAVRMQDAYKKFAANNSLDIPVTGLLAAPIRQTAGAIQDVLTRVGMPYVWGAAGPDSFDCSGLVQWAWAQAGVHLPRIASDQQAWATPVPISQLAPGDLVFFGSPAHHVGMYIGNGLMINAPHAGASVTVVPMWWHDLAGFGRIHQP
jgi:cell wall-associated NlpC family hydrolase